MKDFSEFYYQHVCYRDSDRCCECLDNSGLFRFLCLFLLFIEGGVISVTPTTAEGKATHGGWECRKGLSACSKYE